MTDLVILDNTVLSNLAKAGRADLVVLVWPHAALTTLEVMQEYAAGASLGAVPPERWTHLTVTALTEDERRLAVRYAADLGAGERTCLAVAATRGAFLATDDAGARREARVHSVRLTGTIGLLVLAVHRTVLTLPEGNRLLQEMVAAKFRSPVQRLDDVL